MAAAKVEIQKAEWPRHAVEKKREISA